MNIYSGLSRIDIPDSDRMKSVYLHPRYRKDPVRPVKAVERRNSPVVPESEIGKTARTRMTEGVSSLRNQAMAAPPSGEGLQIRQVASESLGSFFDSYA